MLKDHLLSTITLPDPITAEYYDSIDPFSTEAIWQLAYRDLIHSTVRLESESKLSELCFNSQTVFPASLSQMAQAVLEDGKKDPLHHTSLTGKGIKVAIIDRPLPVEHLEFRGRIHYIDVIPRHEANDRIDFHGTACASFLCGQTCGVAKGVELFYFALPNYTKPISNYYEWQLTAMKKILHYNRSHDEPIRIVSLSAPFQPAQMEKRNELAKELEGFGCTLIDATMFMKNFNGIDYDPYEKCYQLNGWQIKNYERNRDRAAFIDYFNQLCFVPSARRTAADSGSLDEYVHFSKAVSESWTIPHVAGAFAICLEKNDCLTYDEFVRLSKTCPQKNGFRILDIDYMVSLL